MPAVPGRATPGLAPSRMRFVHRVFFRQNDEELQLGALESPDSTSEENEISDGIFKTDKNGPAHRFWPAKLARAEKRKADGEETPDPAAKKARVG